MKYSVFIDPETRQVLWSTTQELADMNMGRLMDGLALFGVIRLCESMADSAQCAAGMAELARTAPNGKA